jgi:preprotein translocase subunit SecG
MTETLFITQIVLAILITVVVLLQKSSNSGFGVYSGSNDSVFGSKGPASFLSKLTFTIGFVFVVNTVALGYFYNQDANASILDDVKSIVPAATTPVAPATPAAPSAPSVPAAPAN